MPSTAAARSSTSVGIDGVRQALGEQRRVVKIGGIVAQTTEVVVNGAEALEEGHLLLST
jgi:hypothetical protein